MKALHRLVVSTHWVVLLGTALLWAGMCSALVFDKSLTLKSLIDNLFFCKRVYLPISLGRSGCLCIRRLDFHWEVYFVALKPSTSKTRGLRRWSS